MSLPRLCIVTLAIPMISMSLSCSSGRLAPMTADPLPIERMMAIGQTFERQGRFAQAQDVYQQVLARDPVSPAAERLLAVIAAAEVTNAQNLPVERMMSVGEFYERHGDVPLAQGVYRQILHRQPDYAPARERLAVIAEHEERKLGKASPAGIRRGRSADRQRSVTTSVTEAQPTKIESDSKTGMDNPVRQVSATWEPTNPSHVSETADILEVEYELPVIGSDSYPSEVEQANADVNTSELGEDERLLPPVPSQFTPDPPPSSSSMDSKPAAEQNSGDRIAELWRDKPLGDLKASISLKFPEPEKLRETERQRLTQATPHMAARGSMVSGIGQSRPWMLSSYEWEAPATRHLPLLFEEPNLERMGYTYGTYFNIWGYESGPHAAEYLQPFVSAAHFWGRVPLIPYMYGVDCPCEPIYTLGVDRPGSPVPYRKHLLPLSLRGALYEAGAAVGIAYILP